MKILAMFSTLLVTLTTVGWYGESQQCVALRTQVEQANLQQQLPKLHTLSQEQTYLLASCEAQEGNYDLAFNYLNALKEHGFNDADWLLADVRFEALHQDGRWQELLDEVSSVQQQVLAEIYAESVSKQPVN